MNKVLIVDDDKEYVNSIENILKDDCVVDHLEDASSVLAVCEKGELKEYSTILFDLYLGMSSGINLFQKAKAILKDNMPLSILISERATTSDRLKVYDSYFFDFIEKSCDDEEVRLRVLNALHYAKKFRGEIIADGLCFDVERQIVKINDTQPILTPIEFKILYYCASHSPGILKEKLIKKVWKNQVVLNQTLNVHIHNLNKKIHFSGNKVSISSGGLASYCKI